ncbi:hypothetical protein [Streptomyces reniochalinae]|uniref:hypothetical protein n=1 Tax=Streptomyces reniochalinae TaxID=2250578 RepID=UPI0015F0CBEA|nr:hypothetical protein [Streptomyces reniochalinae]
MSVPEELKALWRLSAGGAGVAGSARTAAPAPQQRGPNSSGQALFRERPRELSVLYATE